MNIRRLNSAEQSVSGHIRNLTTQVDQTLANVRKIFGEGRTALYLQLERLIHLVTSVHANMLTLQAEEESRRQSDYVRR